MKRVFVAFPVVGAIAEQFLRIEESNNPVDGVRWTRKDNLHVTLFFIGEVEEENIQKIISRLGIVLKNFKPFELKFEKIDLRMSKRKPSMIWARFGKCEEFSELSNAIHESISEFMTITVSHKDPIPHCTLARVKPNAEVEKLNLNFESNPVVTVDKVELWMTVQTKDGVRYESLSRF